MDKISPEIQPFNTRISKTLRSIREISSTIPQTPRHGKDMDLSKIWVRHGTPKIDHLFEKHRCFPIENASVWYIVIYCDIWYDWYMATGLENPEIHSDSSLLPLTKLPISQGLHRYDPSFAWSLLWFPEIKEGHDHADTRSKEWGMLCRYQPCHTTLVLI